MSDPSPDTPNAYAPRCGHHGNPLVWLDPALRWRCPHCFPELFPATPAAPGSSSPDTAALVAELRGPSGLASTSRAKHLTVGVCAVAADALEAQASRITELEARNRRLAGTMTGDTAVDLRVLYAYELGIADATEETHE